MILNALEGKALPVYGNGNQIRDWLYVEDHVRALSLILSKGNVGQTYNIGGHNEKQNLEVVHLICEYLEQLTIAGRLNVKMRPFDGYKSLISFVQDRPGHDLRYAIDASKLKEELGWVPQEHLRQGSKKRSTGIWIILSGCVMCKAARISENDLDSIDTILARQTSERNCAGRRDWNSSLSHYFGGIETVTTYL